MFVFVEDTGQEFKWVVKRPPLSEGQPPDWLVGPDGPTRLW